MEPEPKEPISFKENAEGVLRHVRPYRRIAASLVILGLFSAVANGAVPYVTGRFFDGLLALSEGTTKTTTGVKPWLFFLGVWALIQLVANTADWIEDRRRRAIDTKITLHVQTEGFIHLLKLPLAYHTNTQMSGIIERFSLAGWRISAIVSLVSTIGPQLLSVVIGLTLAATISLALASVLALGVAIYVVLLLHMVRTAAEADEVGQRYWNDRWNDAAQAVQQVTAVKQATAESYEIGRIRGEFMKRAFDLWYKMELLWSNVGALQRMIVFFTQLTVFIFSAHMVARGTLTIGDLVALNGYALMFFGPFVQLGYSWQTIQNGLTSAGQIERVFKEPIEPYQPSEHFTAPAERGEVTFENVHFAYGPEQPVILQDVSFTAPPSTVVALVGKSGAGKSTVAQLISAYYKPVIGSVYVDGLDTRLWDLIALRSRIAVVPQEVALFNDTIEMNIRYGSFKATDDEVADAARRAHIDSFIASLPAGYKTLVGERGIKLSVGQKQRIAIARAMLRNPKILILDEPTSALDTETEHDITNSLEELMRGRTTFIIAHRLSTVRKADRILVLDDGKIVEQGTHAELIEIPNGTYRKLYDLHIGLHE